LATAVAMHLAASQLVVGLIGALVLHVGLFLPETEEGKIQNRLEDNWPLEHRYRIKGDEK